MTAYKAVVWVAQTTISLTQAAPIRARKSGCVQKNICVVWNLLYAFWSKQYIFYTNFVKIC
jgi:hypothetical protein